jgi:hypothetical protein
MVSKEQQEAREAEQRILSQQAREAKARRHDEDLVAQYGPELAKVVRQSIDASIEKLGNAYALIYGAPKS